MLLALWPAYGWDDTARALGLGPTLFAYDISRMIAGVLFMGAAGYGLMRGVHIRADFLYRNWTATKPKQPLMPILYMAFFIPSMIFFTIIAAQYWELAYRTGETAFDSPWEPLLWPARLAMPVGGLLLTLQGYSLNCSEPSTKWEKSANVDFVHGASAFIYSP